MGRLHCHWHCPLGICESNLVFRWGGRRFDGGVGGGHGGQGGQGGGWHPGGGHGGQGGQGGGWHPGTTLKPYDCEAGFSNWRKGWSIPKKHYCCQHKRVACDHKTYHKHGNGGLPYFCDHQPVSEWGLTKALWCCKNQSKGCLHDRHAHHYRRHRYRLQGIENATQVNDAPAEHVNDAPAEWYDCDASYSNWRLGWSSGKQRWCCTNAGRGCTGSPPILRSLSALVTPPQNWHSWTAPSKLLYAGLLGCSAALALLVCGLRAWNHDAHVRRMAVVSPE